MAATPYEARQVKLATCGVVSGSKAYSAGDAGLSFDLPIAFNDAVGAGMAPVWSFAQPGVLAVPIVVSPIVLAPKKVTMTFQAAALANGVLHWHVAGEPA